MVWEKLPAAVEVINGFGKTTGLVQIDELGTLETPILFTNTLSVGTVETALVKYMLQRNPDICETTGSVNPVVCECNDSGLNDIRGANLPLALIAAGNPFLLAQGGAPARKRGGETLVVKASGTKGALRSDIVVTEETAKKLREAEGSSKVLSDAKVVVVVRSDVGGVEGRRRAIADAVEFTHR